MSLTDKIIENTIALIVFTALGAGVFVGLDSMVASVTDPTVKLVIPLIGVLFVLGIALSVYYELVKHHKK
jgi:hypothetical protein